MLVMYGNRYHSIFPDGTHEEVTQAVLDMKQEWFDSDVTKLDKMTVDKVLRVCKETLDWPPNLAEFLKICRSPEATGLPDVAEAYSLATQETLRKLHPVIQSAVLATGVFELRNMPEHRTRPIFERNYEIALKRYARGEDVGAPIPKALPEPPEPKITPKAACEARQEFQRLKEALRAP